METILVVDDENGVRSLVRDILEPRGYPRYRGPCQALRIARAHPTPIDLFLIDVMMPFMNGTEVALKVAIRLRTVRSPTDNLGHHALVD